jgi:hypothetical protein
MCGRKLQSLVAPTELPAEAARFVLWTSASPNGFCIVFEKLQKAHLSSSCNKSRSAGWKNVQSADCPRRFVFLALTADDDFRQAGAARISDSAFNPSTGSAWRGGTVRGSPGNFQRSRSGFSAEAITANLRGAALAFSCGTNSEEIRDQLKVDLAGAVPPQRSMRFHQ